MQGRRWTILPDGCASGSGQEDLRGSPRREGPVVRTRTGQRIGLVFAVRAAAAGPRGGHVSVSGLQRSQVGLPHVGCREGCSHGGQGHRPHDEHGRSGSQAIFLARRQAADVSRMGRSRNSSDVQRRVLQERGGKDGGEAGRDSIRLFMVPGMGHCAGGDGPNTFDAMAALSQWVEKGQGSGADGGVAQHARRGGSHASAVPLSAGGAV